MSYWVIYFTVLSVTYQGTESSRKKNDKSFGIQAKVHSTHVVFCAYIYIGSILGNCHYESVDNNPKVKPQ